MMYLFNHLSQIKKILYFIGLSLFFVCLQGYGLLPMIGAFHISAGMAYAHGGGGGDGGGGGGGGDGGNGGGDACGGGSGDGTAGPCSNSEAVADHQSPGVGGIDFEPHIILAINADQTALKKARNTGLIIGQKVLLKSLGLVVTRLRIPGDVSPKNISDRLTRETGANTEFDLNHYYELADDSKRKGIRSYPRVMIGWPTDGLSRGSGARIGMVDTPVAVNMPALGRQKIITRSFTGTTDTSLTDHGTSIATILVGARGSDFPGLLPDARLYSASAFFRDRKGNLHTTALTIARAINWLISVRVQVMNLSLTGPDNKLLRTVVKRTSAGHIFLVAAAGNGGPYAPPAYPAAYNNVIAVTAIDRFFRPYRWANRGRYITFAAPGVNIRLPNSDGRGTLKTGTSYASAFCTALATRLVVREKVTGSTATLIRVMRKNSIDLGAPGKDDIFGWGLIHN